ncbi:sensor histidine kinase [Rhizobiaceae bacterium BDR2-2]|uniref:Oxygen sensor histidine kinase NreB n=1 Tax=Ectorhizobium quercum TaxID=2965071 RepID=A0AAE3SW29_9HYPH|nr:sensor histidine kinase [Ectorhizobium quercum]MCX8997030.1 sensor histidine kinase [Ectorhizobium quercum]
MTPTEQITAETAGITRFSLLKQFLAMSATVLTLGMAAIGFWVTLEIEEGVTDNAAAMTALYVDGIVAPVTQGLEQGGVDERTSEALDFILTQGALSREIAVFKLWSPKGEILYSSDRALVGRTFELTEGLSAAIGGRLHAEFDRLDSEENVSDNSQRGPLLEIYSPVRSSATGEVVAVAEFYAVAENLQANLFEARRQTWLVVGGVTLLMLSAFYLLISRADTTIKTQRAALGARLDELSRLLSQNETLTRRLDQANRRISAINERVLRRISSELHDGPTQHLAFAALRLDSARTGDGQALESVRLAVDEAVKEIRQICLGLSLPELENWSLATIAARLATVHESRTEKAVELDVEEGLPELSTTAKVGVYRFIQEALNNVAKHAGDVSPVVRIASGEGGVEIVVEDSGRGFDMQAPATGLGLAGMRERVASLKGRLDILSRKGTGTRVAMWVPQQSEDDEP